MKNKINEYLFLYFSLGIWYLYFLYTIVLTIYNFNNLIHLNWKQASNQTIVYSSRRSTTISYIFEKESIGISRKYPGLIEGINTWLWGIDKKKYKEDLSFYIRKKDYEKIKNNQLPYKKDILGNNYSEKKNIPFFGLRKIDFYSSKLFLFLDIWKYNYNWLAFIIVVIAPYTLIYLLKKSKLITFFKDETKNKNDKYWNFAFIFLLTITVFNLII
ncbi:hypothetical protein ETU09_00135 [Apibacter muscae]|uniref:Uncharacterized protein n=1 Tax=Apibacter muscae TaxID=2509004 RepID=A0A563DKM1_9FLAO|nr:hypothetical protein [Apibacter muscae]TWP30808.1 hypothetical protein ETU09_00135 [Apibacter muscae]